MYGIKRECMILFRNLKSIFTKFYIKCIYFLELIFKKTLQRKYRGHINNYWHSWSIIFVSLIPINFVNSFTIGFKSMDPKAGILRFESKLHHPVARQAFFYFLYINLTYKMGVVIVISEKTVMKAELIYRKCLEQLLGHKKYHISVIYEYYY